MIEISVDTVNPAFRDVKLISAWGVEWNRTGTHRNVCRLSDCSFSLALMLQRVVGWLGKGSPFRVSPIVGVSAPHSALSCPTWGARNLH